MQILVRKKDAVSSGALSSRLAMSSDVPLSVIDSAVIVLLAHVTFYFYTLPMSVMWL